MTKTLDLSTTWRFLSHFQEMFIMILIAGVIILIGEYRHKDRMKLLHQPLVNDFYFVDYYQIDKSSDRKYRFLPIKITDIDEETIAYIPGAGGHSEPTSIDKHIRFDAPMHYNFFQRREYTVSKEEFQHWVDSGVIYDVARPERFYINGWIVLSPMEVLRGKQINETLYAQL